MTKWPRKKLGEVAEHSLGKMLDKAKNKGEPKPYLRNLNVRWFDFDLSDVLEMRFLPAEESRYTIAKGDLVICEGGYPGRAAIWDSEEPIYFQKALHRVRFHEPERNEWFLYYLYAKDLDGTLKSHFGGTGIQHLTGETLHQLEVPLPPLPEQKRIVGILDKSFEAIANAKANADRNLQNALAIFPSILAAALNPLGRDWRQAELQSLLLEGRKISYGIVKPGEHDPAGVRLIKSQQVRDNAMDLSADFRITRQLDKEYARTRLQGGEILLNLVGASIGRSAIAPEELRGANVSRAIAVIPVRHEIASWVQYNLRGSAGQQLIESKTGGSAQPVLNLCEVTTLTIPLPPLAEQRAVVRKLDELSEETLRLQAICEQKLAALDAMKSSLLHQAFTGEL